MPQVFKQSLFLFTGKKEENDTRLVFDTILFECSDLKLNFVPRREVMQNDKYHVQSTLFSSTITHAKSALGIMSFSARTIQDSFSGSYW